MPFSKQCALLLALGTLLFLSACQQAHHDITRGFYYWKTVYKPTPSEVAELKELAVQRMYIRLFDVDWDVKTMQPMPVAPVQLPANMDTSLQYVPVVFITQKTIAAISEKDIPGFADKINAFVAGICTGAGIKPGELQIDCDWTEGTKDVYFKLLTQLRQEAFFKGKILSCTIRLHQVKFVDNSGVPPVDRGMLMCYSMGNLKKYGALNSILDVMEAARYLTIVNKYPLKLDVALPVFQWCILFHQKEFAGILHEVGPEMVINDKQLFQQSKGNLYTCLKDATWHGYNLVKGDELRVEGVPVNDLQDIANFTAKRIKNPEMNIVFFSCDSITLSKYSAHELQTVYNIYQ
jgi:hypothetical protein